MLILTVYRNSVGKLGFARYDLLIANKDRDLYIHVYTIWVTYFFQILITLVLGLNLMIAIIETTFSVQKKFEEANLYRNKAELNQECADIISFFKKP